MSLPRPLPCAFYRTTAGNEPVREWLKALPEGERKQVGSDIKAVQMVGRWVCRSWIP